jgi:hypothetical protein
VNQQEAPNRLLPTIVAMGECRRTSLVFPNCNTNNYVVQFDDLSGCPAGHRRLSFSKRSLPQWRGLI